MIKALRQKGEEKREEDNLFDGIIDSPKRRGRRRKMGEWSETSSSPAAAAAADQCPAKRESSVKVSKECALPVRRTRERERERAAVPVTEKSL